MKIFVDTIVVSKQSSPTRPNSGTHISRVYSTCSPSASLEFDQKIPTSDPATLSGVSVITVPSSGEIRFTADKSQYNLIRDYFAKRTYEESGDYSLEEFEFDVLDSLNDGVTGEGVYKEDEITEQGNEPDDDLMVVKVSSGKAYVRGYDISLESSSLIDVAKPRDVKTIDSALVPYQMLSLIHI